MILETIHELTIIGVADPGIPGHERIVIRPAQVVNLAEFAVFLGEFQPNGMVRPYTDNFLWLGELTVAPPSWIHIYTGPGNFEQSKIPNTGETAYVFHWGKTYTVFQKQSALSPVPFLFRLNGISIGPPTFQQPLFGQQ